MPKLKGSSLGANSNNLNDILGNRVSRVNNIYYRIANSYMRNPGGSTNASSNINIIGSSMKNSASLSDLSKAPQIGSGGGALKHSNLAMYQKKPRYAAGSILATSTGTGTGPKVKGLGASPSAKEVLSPL